MALEEKERIIIPDENGEEHLFEILVTFDVDQTDATYIAVSLVDEIGGHDVEVFPFRYEERANDEDNLALYHIESEEEWEMVDEVLNTLTGEDLI